ncbi:MAG TPA: hypothetical protein VE820_11700 [Sphingomicrobium sp.]|jgi:hypothetical protein|nr:hypothetical protein [Sphingomicrobium sp.]
MSNATQSVPSQHFSIAWLLEGLLACLADHLEHVLVLTALAVMAMASVCALR